MPAEFFPAALSEWIKLLGEGYVTTDPAERRRAETATFATSHSIPAILKPANKEQILGTLAISRRFSIPLYPISSGKNWGYGSRVPPADNCVLLDLSRLNQILDFNEDLGYVTVEPGVTQRQLYNFLQEKRSGLWMDATGSSPDCSLIGNTMERGFGHTPYGEHFAHVCGLQVILANGETLETGLARFGECASAPVSRWGVGASLDGLFSQSNLGIVTRMTIWLMPAPEAFAAFFFRSEAEDGLPDLIDALRRLRLSEHLRSAIHIANDYKVLAGLRQYPWEKTGGQTPLGLDQMTQFRKDLTFGYWSASGGLYGTAAQVRESKRLLRMAVAKLPGKLRFVNEKTLRVAKRFAKPFRLVTGWDIARTAELVEPVIGLMKGVPTEQPLGSAYWRKRTSIPKDPDPDRDGCGLLWYAPVAPAEGQAVRRVTELARRILLAHGFEPGISLTMISPRAVNCVISITYDRQVEGEDERALHCYRELEKECEMAGYYPYRLGTLSMQREPLDGAAQLLGIIRSAIDPQRLLAPGRYER